MRLVKESVRQFARAKAVTYSEHYIVCSTGGQVKIFDKNLNLLQIIKGVRYVYKCLISPDESKLLLVSAANYFYIVELDTFCITKHTIKGKYSRNLEGNGCWSLDGNGCCFCVMSAEVNSALRIYDDIQKDVYRELLCDKYWLTSILAIPKRNKYLLTGYDRANQKSYLIWFDGKKFEEYPVQGLSQFSAVKHAKLIENGDYCIVVGSNNTVFCTTEGIQIGDINLPETSPKTFSFSDVFKTFDINEESRAELVNLSKQYGLEDMAVPDEILDVCQSSNGRYFYVATLGSLLCINAKTHKKEVEKEYPFGVTAVEEICENLLLVNTWDSLELVRIDFEQ